MNLAFHPYELRSAEPLGARSLGRTRYGALLRVQGDGGETGYADLHPWAELGDLPLAAQLTQLSRGETTALSQASLAFAALDGQARSAGRSLWASLTVPESHFLLPGFAEGYQDALEAALAEGFTCFKIKVGKDLAAEERALLDLSAFLPRVSLPGGGHPRLRLDYNETLTPAQFAQYFAGLEALRSCLDFIEDPFPYRAADWSEMSAKFGIRFALDRAAGGEDAGGVDGGGAEEVLIHKPARAGRFLPAGMVPRPPRRLVVTSYLDHPLGQLCAAWVAAMLPEEAQEEKHGLVSHRVYERTRFSDRLGWSGPHLSLPGGHGFGFDEELTRLDWKTLT